MVAPIEKEISDGPERQHDQPTGTSTVVPEPPAVSATATTDAESVVATEQVATPQSTFVLPDTLCKQAGLLKLTKDGPWTSPYGDEHAAKILDGTIPFEDAKRDHLAAIRHMSKWAESYFPKEKRASYV